ncbi:MULTISPECIES: DUF4912 domain-containing protein [Pseudothermotoga]|uniref:DUF4912 domain-containing protein n=1 Tax=Pseudothermotoga TaxID=1643951 RepID=UPI0007471015|nr:MULTISPECIES: DUF4912 domain-containing protein [Pseudothermotoga]KUK21200.1 MAG: Uncharacterized protein XD56_0886 [Pseudothermotoga lettingae]MDI3494919.1 uncharacterized protein [Pseudothermotoga sp.]MDK2885034.1 uncharacterized protein [Pseudothermotoga sp.]HBJ81226.1 DUF4912 domain-containing protein [Pseudothermotoga sp.]HBT26497.1 DUF4912 domain-containing protein [Pseudothermotoga sp.]
MKRQDLFDFLHRNPSIQEAKALAKKLGLKVKKMMKKQEVYKLISEYASKLPEEATSPPASAKRTVQEINEIPFSYGSDKIVLLPVNPHLVYLYWDLSAETFEKLSKAKNVAVRLYDVTFIIFDGKNAHRIFEAGIDLGVCRNYYFHVPMSNADYIAEIGYKNGYDFIPLLRSNLCKTPSDSPSPSNRQRWYIRGKKYVFVGEAFLKPVEHIGGSHGSSFSNLAGDRK